MFTHLIALVTGRPSHEAEERFVLDVRRKPQPRAPREPRMLRFIAICWVLIAIKHVFILYACHHWPVPFNALWLNAPTWLLGVLATAVYYLRRNPS